MGSESSTASDNSSSNSNDDRCNHGWNANDLHYDIRPNDTVETVHYKNEYNDASDRTLSFEPAGDDAASSIVQSFIDGHTLRNAESNIEQGCGDCKNECQGDDCQ
jgi:hypothetical protein